MANWQITTAWARFTYDLAVSSWYNFLVWVDANHFLALWADGTDSDGFAQIIAVNTSTWAVTTAAAVLEFDTQANGDSVAIDIDSTHFVTFFRGYLNDWFVQTFTVNTSTWAITTAAASLEFDTQDAGNISAVKIDTNHCICVWTWPASDGFIQTFTVNTTTWAVTTAAASLEFDTQQNTAWELVAIDANHFLVFWSGGASTYQYAQVFTVNTTTWAVTTAAASFNFESVTPTGNPRHTPHKIDDTHFINFWIDDGQDLVSQVFAVNTTTWAVTTAWARFEDADTFNNFSATRIDSTHFLVMSKQGGGAPGWYSVVYQVDTATWAITTAYNEFQWGGFGGAAGHLSYWYKIDTTHFLAMWGDQWDADSYMQVLAIEVPASWPVNIKSVNTNVAANIKSLNGNVIANIKSYNTNA